MITEHDAVAFCRKMIEVLTAAGEAMEKAVMEFLLSVPRNPPPKESSNVRALGYVEEINAMVVEYHSGAIWAYANVSPVTYHRVLNADSVGSALREYVVKEKEIYPGRLVLESCPSTPRVVKDKKKPESENKPLVF